MGAAGLDDLAGRILDELPFAVIVTDVDGTVTFWSARAAELYGWDSSEAVGRPIGTLTVQSADARQAEEIMESLARGRTWEGTFTVARRDGSTFLAHVRDVPLLDVDGKVMHIVGLSEPADPDVGAEIRLERLEAVTSALAAALTPDDAADAVMVEGAAVFGAQSVALCRLDGDHRLEVVAAKNFPAAALTVIESAPVDDLEIPLAVAVRTRAPVLLEHDDGGGALAALPLVAGDDVVGGLALGFELPRSFSATDRRILLGLASASAQALHRASLSTRVDESLQLLNAFMETAPVGLALIDEELRFQSVNDYMARLIGIDGDVVAGNPVDVVVGATDPDLGPLVQSVVDSDTPLIGIELRGVGGADMVVVASLYPVSGSGRVRCVGMVASDVTAARNDEARLREESQIVESLHFVGRQLAGELEPSRVLEVVTEAAAMVTGADVAVFLAPDEERADESVVPVVLASAGDAARFLADFDATLVGPTLRGGQVVRLGDAGGRSGAVSFLGVPLTSRDGASLGALFLTHHRAGVFDERDERLVVGIAGQGAVALDDARLYQAERQARQQLTLLAEAGNVLASSLDIEDLLREVANLVVPGLADVCAIDLEEDDGSVRRVVTAGELPDLARELERHGPTPDDLTKPSLRRIRQASAVQYVTIDEAFVAASWPDDPGYQRLLLAHLSSAAVIPMVARHGAVGRLSLVMGPSGREFSPADATLLLDLGRRIAVAVENARLFARQRSVAVTLQESLLPDRLPNVPGVTMAARYLPGGPDIDVGGDWYDVLAMPDGTMGFAMGDVVGRGVRAAALMGQLRSALRGYALEGHRPGACLEHLDVLLQVITGGALVTAVKGHLYPSEGRVVMANAGHLPPLVLHADGEVEFVASALGVPLSTLEPPCYDDITLDLAPGTTIVLYTDGLVEERDESLEVGLARLVDACGSAPRDDLEALCDHILASLLAGRESRDDVALLVVRLDGLS